MYKVGQANGEPHYGQTLCHRATEEDIRKIYPFDQKALRFHDEIQVVPFLQELGDFKGPEDGVFRPAQVKDFIQAIKA
jgi:hypothetical protein